MFSVNKRTSCYVNFWPKKLSRNNVHFVPNYIIYQLSNLKLSVKMRLKEEVRLVIVRKTIAPIFLTVTIFLTGCTAKDSQQDIGSNPVIQKDGFNYVLTVPLNLELMKQYRDKSLNEDIPNPFGDLELLESKEIIADLEFLVIDGIANVKGTVTTEDGTYNFDGKGLFLEFTAPDTKNRYYYSDIQSEMGFNYLVFFSVEDNRAFIETPVPVELGDYKGHLMFGEKFTNKKYWDALGSAYSTPKDPFTEELETIENFIFDVFKTHQAFNQVGTFYLDREMERIVLGFKDFEDAQVKEFLKLIKENVPEERVAFITVELVNADLGEIQQNISNDLKNMKVEPPYKLEIDRKKQIIILTIEHLSDEQQNRLHEAYGDQLIIKLAATGY